MPYAFGTKRGSSLASQVEARNPRPFSDGEKKDDQSLHEAAFVDYVIFSADH
jgi:hypothetical protein